MPTFLRVHVLFSCTKRERTSGFICQFYGKEVLTNQEGKATGVAYINKEDRREYALKGRIVVMAASACSTARILLNSKSSQHPNGLGNSSNLVENISMIQLEQTVWLLSQP